VNVDERGCPIDTDNDGVYDGLDMCLRTRPGAVVNEQGCEEQKAAPLPIEHNLVLHNITFASGSADILTSSYGPLDTVAESLIDNPHTRIEVRGYADSQGSESFNLRLTQQRSESVRAYLISRGVAPVQLTARGFGESQPLAPNDTAEGRAMNRRVEFYRTDR